jgi:hypothetical protein
LIIITENEFLGLEKQSKRDFESNEFIDLSQINDDDDDDNNRG